MILSKPRNTCQWKLAGSKTFRLASSAFFDKGTNLQNPSTSIAPIYIPDDGCVFVQCDQAGAEALVVAHECGPGNFLALFQNGIKPHTFVAMHRFEKFWESSLKLDMKEYISAGPARLATLPRWKELNNAIKKDELKYAIGKMLCHASNYDMEANTFKQNVLERTNGTLVLTSKEAAELLASYHALFPEIRRWHARVRDELRATRTLRNLFGYPRVFSGAWCPKFEKEAYAFVPQSTVGTITNIAFTDLFNYISDIGKDWIAFNNKHDSYMAQVPISEAFEAARVMKIFIEQELTSSLGVKYKMKSETQIGTNWGKYSEENPNGMKEVIV